MINNIAPPRHNAVVGIGVVSHRPIHLWRDEVYESEVEPLHDVDILASVVVVVATRARVDAIFVGKVARGVGSTLRSLTEAHPRLSFLKHIVELLHQHGHILATPVGLRESTSGSLVAVVEIGIFAQGSAIVVVVVEKHSVDVVVLRDFLADGNNAVLHLGDTGIENLSRAAIDGPALLYVARNVAFLSARSSRAVEAIGIDPRMALNAALVALGNEELKWVPTRVLATGSGDILRPRLIARLVHGIAHAAHLEVDGIEIIHGK